MVTAGGTLGSWGWRTMVRNTFPLLIVLSIIVLIAGITLEDARGMFDEYGILAVMVPTMVGMGGNLGVIMSARLSTRLHLGTTDLDPRDPVLLANVAAILALAVTVFAVLATGAYLFGVLVGNPIAFTDLLVISLVSGLAVAVIAIVLSFAATYTSYRLGVDPDDVTIPIVTNVVDVFGMVIFITVSAMVLEL